MLYTMVLEHIVSARYVWESSKIWSEIQKRLVSPVFCRNLFFHHTTFSWYTRIVHHTNLSIRGHAKYRIMLPQRWEALFSTSVLDSLWRASWKTCFGETSVAHTTCSAIVAFSKFWFVFHLTCLCLSWRKPTVYKIDDDTGKWPNMLRARVC